MSSVEECKPYSATTIKDMITVSSFPMFKNEVLMNGFDVKQIEINGEYSYQLIVNDIPLEYHSDHPLYIIIQILYKTRENVEHLKKKNSDQQKQIIDLQEELKQVHNWEDLAEIDELTEKLDKLSLELEKSESKLKIKKLKKQLRANGSDKQIEIEIECLKLQIQQIVLKLEKPKLLEREKATGKGIDELDILKEKIVELEIKIKQLKSLQSEYTDEKKDLVKDHKYDADEQPKSVDDCQTETEQCATDTLPLFRRMHYPIREYRRRPMYSQRSLGYPYRSLETSQRFLEIPQRPLETPQRPLETPQRPLETPQRSWRTPKNSSETSLLHLNDVVDHHIHTLQYFSRTLQRPIESSLHPAESLLHSTESPQDSIMTHRRRYYTRVFSSTETP